MILLGEMRDLETISTALTAAETGHLVFATLHTQSAPGTIDRVIDVFPAAQQDQVRIQLAATLEGVVTQALLPTADGNGRVAALEILFPDDAVRNLIRQAKVEQVYSVMQTGTAKGMQTMEQSLADLTLRGVITLDVALSRSSRPEQLARPARARRLRRSRPSADRRAPTPSLRVAEALAMEWNEETTCSPSSPPRRPRSCGRAAEPAEPDRRRAGAAAVEPEPSPRPSSRSPVEPEPEKTSLLKKEISFRRKPKEPKRARARRRPTRGAGEERRC